MHFSKASNAAILLGLFRLANAKLIDKPLFGYIQNILDEARIVGMSMAIISPTGAVEYANWGRRTESGEAVTSNTIFGLGSCSKQFLPASIGLLMQDFAEGRNVTTLPSAVKQFDWSTKLRDLLPDEWEMDNEWATQKADLKDLLSHRTGLPNHEGCYSPQDTPADVVSKIKNLRTAYEMRQFWEYNNQMYFTGAYIVSKYAGMPYREFVEQRIFNRLNMSSSTLHPEVANATSRFSQTWTPLNGRRIPFFVDGQAADLMAGAGGVISSVEDMVVWAKTMLNGGIDANSNQTIIPRSTYDLATSAISVPVSVGSNISSIAGYGFGWVRASYRGHEWLWHDGGAPGVSSRVDIYPYDGFATILLCNTAVVTQATADSISRTVADRLLRISPIDHRVSPGVDIAVPPPQKDAASTESLSGTYYNAGYGNITLCSPALNVSYCQSTIESFRIIDAAVVGRPESEAVTQLMATWSRFWGTHVRISPLGDGSYVFQMTNLYPHGYGANSTAFEDPTYAWVAKFEQGADGKTIGMGLVGVAMLPTIRQTTSPSTNVRDVVDVWFDKVH